MPLPDKYHQQIQKLIEKHQPQSMEEMQKLMNSLIGQSIDDIEFKAETDEEKAEEMVWECYEMEPLKGRAKAKRALKLDPLCVAAHEYLGNSYQYYHKAAPHFAAGIEAGKQKWGEAFFKENKGHFWMMTETRPFMRCMGGLAESCYRPGQTGKAVEVWEEMLSLNPNDNQGIRYPLFSALLEQKELKKFKKYSKDFRTEDSTMTSYPRALASFMEYGDSPKSNKVLAFAKKQNAHVIPLLLQEFPPDEMPESYSWGSEEEALIYLHYAWRSWSEYKNPGAKDWLRKNRL